MVKCSLLGCVTITYMLFLFVVYVKLFSSLIAEYILIIFIITVMGVAIYKSLFGGVK